jgi:uncharacterized protein (DUF4415 family)
MKTEYDFDNVKRGAIVPQPGKTRITIYIDDDVLETLRESSDAAGKGYQTMINQALRESLGEPKSSFDEATLRRILQEELRSVLTAG